MMKPKPKLVLLKSAEPIEQVLSFWEEGGG